MCQNTLNILKFIFQVLKFISLQCFDTVGWVVGKVSELQKPNATIPKGDLAQPLWKCSQVKQEQ